MGLRDELLGLRNDVLERGEGPFEWRMTSIHWQQCKNELPTQDTWILDPQNTVLKGLFGDPVIEKNEGDIEYIRRANET